MKLSIWLTQLMSMLSSNLRNTMERSSRTAPKRA